MEKVGFWSTKDRYGAFSNWYKCKFILDGMEFTSSEQALMYCKADFFEDEEIATKILQTTYPRDIKALGRKVKNFDGPLWNTYKYRVMVEILMQKFGQNDDLRHLLLSTGSAEIYETSPKDNIWGIGSTDVNDIRGQNLLGKALMEVRDKIKEK